MQPLQPLQPHTNSTVVEGCKVVKGCNEDYNPSTELNSNEYVPFNQNVGESCKVVNSPQGGNGSDLDGLSPNASHLLAYLRQNGGRASYRDGINGLSHDLIAHGLVQHYRYQFEVELSVN